MLAGIIYITHGSMNSPYTGPYTTVLRQDFNTDQMNFSYIGYRPFWGYIVSDNECNIKSDTIFFSRKLQGFITQPCGPSGPRWPAVCGVPSERPPVSPLPLHEDELTVLINEGTPELLGPLCGTACRGAFKSTWAFGPVLFYTAVRHVGLIVSAGYCERGGVGLRQRPGLHSTAQFWGPGRG